MSYLIMSYELCELLILNKKGSTIVKPSVYF
jgi:hypothetical protein